VERENLLPLISNCYSSAIKKLIRSYQANRPAAILVSEGRFGPNYVIDGFLDFVEEDTVVVRIDGSCTDPKMFMQAVVRNIGFEPNDMSLADLEKVFEMFLQYQRSHNLRTVIAIQDSDAQSWWVLDKIRRLVELEEQEKYGLKIVVSGPPNVISVLNEPILDVITAAAGERIVLTPFTLSETRNYLSRIVENVDLANHKLEDVSQVFEFLAVTLIHDICSGVPDDVHRLCIKCLELFHDTSDHPVSIDTVKKAAALLGLTNLSLNDQGHMSAVEETTEVAPPGRLLIQTRGEEDSAALLNQSCFVIGRDQMCNICIHGLQVSRFHAMVSMSTKGLHIADLGSTNGTVVNGEKVKRCELHDGDTITIGDTRITYAAGSEQLTREPEIDSLHTFEICETEPNPCIMYLGQDLQLMRTS
jgi:type II secretory pathway predicted ATPase ExeA